MPKSVISHKGRLTLAHRLLFRMPVASMAPQTQIGERIKGEIRSVPASYLKSERWMPAGSALLYSEIPTESPEVSGQQVICKFPHPLGSALRAALSSSVIVLFTIFYTSSSKNKGINKVSPVCLLQFGMQSLQNPLCMPALTAEGGGWALKHSFLPSFIISAPIPCGWAQDDLAATRSKGDVVMGFDIPARDAGEARVLGIAAHAGKGMRQQHSLAGKPLTLLDSGR